MRITRNVLAFLEIVLLQVFNLHDIKLIFLSYNVLVENVQVSVVMV